MPKSTTDIILIRWQQEKYLDNAKSMYLALIELEKFTICGQMTCNAVHIMYRGADSEVRFSN